MMCGNKPKWTYDGGRVRAIRFEETRGKATLRFDADAGVEARVATEFRYGTEWIVIALQPVDNDLAPLLRPIESRTFGSVETRLNGRTATLALELLAERIDYSVGRGPDGALVVTFARANGK